jgi:hypothetical protein
MATFHTPPDSNGNTIVSFPTSGGNGAFFPLAEYSSNGNDTVCVMIGTGGAFMYPTNPAVINATITLTGGVKPYTITNSDEEMHATPMMRTFVALTNVDPTSIGKAPEMFDFLGQLTDLNTPRLPGTAIPSPSGSIPNWHYLGYYDSHMTTVIMPGEPGSQTTIVRHSVADTISIRYEHLLHILPASRTLMAVSSIPYNVTPKNGMYGKVDVTARHAFT